MRLVWVALVFATTACGRIRFDPLDGGLGDGARADAAPPTPARRAVFGGRWRTCVVIDGQPWCWGANHFGQLGDGTQIMERGAPAPVLDLVDVVTLSLGADGGDHAVTSDPSHMGCALRADRTIACWGRNDWGQLGNGSTLDSSRPIPVPGLTDVVMIAVGGDHACALRDDGELSCWGYNEFGQLGIGSADTSTHPNPMAVSLADVAWVDAGDHHTCAVTRASEVWCWGRNDTRQLASTGGDSPAPQLVGGLAATRVWATSFSTCAQRTSGAIACWGADVTGILGDGSAYGPGDPGQATPGDMLDPVSDAVFSHATACAIGPVLSCWGDGIDGGLGNGGTASTARPLPVAGGLAVAAEPYALAVGAHHGCVVTTDDSVWCWGFNNRRQATNTTNPNELAPVRVVGLP